MLSKNTLKSYCNFNSLLPYERVCVMNVLDECAVR